MCEKRRSLTYLIINEFEKRLQLLESIMSGTPSADDYFTFDSKVLDNYDAGKDPSGFSSNTLTLKPGYYFARCFLSVTRTGGGQSAASNYEFQFEVNGSAVGAIGQTGEYNNTRSDVAEVVFEDSSSNITLKVKCTNIESSAPTLDTNSRLYLWRVEI